MLQRIVPDVDSSRISLIVAEWFIYRQR